MKKLKKYSIEDLCKIMPSMSEIEKKGILGAGIIYRFDSNGNLLTANDDGTSGPNMVECNGQYLELSGSLCYSSYQYEDEYGNTQIGHSLAGGGMDLFYFLADNTDVEWGASYNNGSDAYLNTSHDQHSVNASFQEGYSNYIHSHPTVGETQGEPSSNDISTGVAMLRRNYRGKETGVYLDYNYEHFSIYKAHSSGSIEDDTVDYTKEVRDAYPW